MPVRPDPCRLPVVRSRPVRSGAGRRLRLALAVGVAASLVGSAGTATAAVSEGFVNGTGPIKAWLTANRSQPLGVLSGWGFANTETFSAHQGPANSYVGANYQSTAGAGTISNWLWSPRMLLANGQTVSFYTRAAGSGIADRMEFRVSTNGSCAPGEGADQPGDFTRLLTTVNPTLAANGYPSAWTQVSATLSGLPADGATGCFAFHYSVPNGGPEGINSDYIGVDTFLFSGDYAPPNAPVLASFSPSSPANDNQPRVVGASDFGTVRIYTDPTCSGTPVAGGSDAGLADGLAVPVDDDSSTTLYATVTDERVSLMSACSTASPTYVEDSTPPATSDDVPGGWVTTAPTATLTASDAHGVAATHFTVGANPATPTTASPVYDPAQRPVLQDGERIRYFSVDAAGNSETVKTSAVVRIDAVAPTTTDDVPSAWQGTPPAVTLTASDAGELAATHFTVGTDPATPTTASPVYDPAQRPVLQDGERIRYFSVDAAGNDEAVRTSAVARVDATPPTTTDAITATTTPGQPAVLTATDGQSGVGETYFTVGTDPALPTTASPVYDPTHPPVLAAGERIRYFSVDAVGNRETPRSSLAISVPPKPEPQPEVKPDPEAKPAPQPQPELVPQPPAPQPDPLPTTCEVPFVALVGIEQQGTARAPRVQLTGVAARALAGEQVEVERDGRRIATAQVGSAGQIEVRVAAPRTLAARARARYRLVLGTVRTSALKATRRVVVVRRQNRADGRVVVDGRLLGARRATSLRVTATPVCGASSFAGTSVRTDRSGRFRVVLERPTGDSPLLAYRVRQGSRLTSLPLLVPRS